MIRCIEAGNHMVFFVLNLIEALGMLLTFKPFLALPNHNR